MLTSKFNFVNVITDRLTSLENVFLFTVNIVHTKKKAGQDVSMIPICDLCKRKEDKRVEVTFFELPPMIEDVLSLLQKVQESATFQELWVKCGHKAQTARKNDETHKRDLSISNVVDSVWKPAYDAWSQLVSSVMNGTLTLGGVDKFFESYKNRKEDLIQELVCILNLGEHQAVRNTSQLKTTAAKRASQIQHYHELHQYANAADTIWEFKEAMKFSGDFSVIEDLRDQVSIVISLVHIAPVLFPEIYRGKRQIEGIKD